MTSDGVSEHYAFVSNITSLQREEYTIAPGHVLRHATEEEVTEIKRWIDQLSGTHFYLPYLWEAQLPIAGNVVPLPAAAWRYYVIAFAGNNSGLLDLQAASDIAPTELEIAFTITRGGGMSSSPSRLFHVFQNAGFGRSFFLSPSDADIEKIAALYREIQASDRGVIDVRNFAKQVGNLKGFFHGSPLRFLGYFALLESLLTHAPKPSDPYDSITRQVKKKINLLNHRWTIPIDYSPFGGAGPEKVWARMYEYRSALAHGGHADFTTSLELLRNPEQALNLVKETVKAIIRHALTEPTLLVDLREC